jgi:hypothetical protein
MIHMVPEMIEDEATEPTTVEDYATMRALVFGTDTNDTDTMQEAA